MNNLFTKIKDYFIFWLKAGDEHILHSPFLFEWYMESVVSPKNYYAFEQIEQIRLQLLHNQDIIEIQDFGAKGNNQIRKEKVSNIAKRTSIKYRIGEILFRTVDYFQPSTILELGTSCGISTLYLSEASHKNTKIYSFEGSPELLEIAQKNLQNKHKIDWVLGNLDNTLIETLKEVQKIDFVFFDANHRYEPTIRYFNLCLEKAHEDSIFIFDDIYWSEEMKKAWSEICANPNITFSLDLFFIGIVFFRKKQPKQHFLLKI